MGGKSGGGPQITEYSMSAWYGLCLAGVRLRALYFGEKIGWSAEDTQDIDSNSESISGSGISTNTQDIVAIPVNAPTLFGGDEKEGGVVGTVYWLPGSATQTMPAELASKLGRTPSTMTGARGKATIFFVGASAALGAAVSAGFVWGKNNPYLKTLWAKVTREPVDIGLDNDTAFIGDHANPSHIIYDALTSVDCMGAPASLIDTEQFNAVAQTLFDEAFMLSMGWFEQDKVENFIAEVLDHIHATVFIQPSTGLFTIKLLRADYVKADLPLYDESNATLRNFQRKAVGECINEVSVDFTNRETGNVDQNATAQDLGNIIAQGGIISTNRNYYGIQIPELAGMVAQRDVAASSAPLGSGTLYVNRDGFDSVPGGVLRVSNVKQRLDDVVFRITGIDRGNVGDAQIALNITEDIFGFLKGDAVTPPASLHDDTGTVPTPAPYSLGFTMPAFFAVQFTGTMPADPNVYGAVIATATADDTFSYELWVLGVDIGGNPEYQPLGTRALSGRGTLLTSLDAEATSITELAQNTKGVGPRINGFALIQGANEAVSEIVFLRDVDSNGDWTLDRGMLDTTPHDWPSGTPIWYLSLDSPFGDATARAPTEIVTYKVLPRTTLGTLPLDSAPALVNTLSYRSYAPSRPANVKVNTQGFGVVDAIGDPSLEVSWANRDRLLEETQIFKWTDVTQTLPAGQTSVVRVTDVLNNLIIEHDSLGGTSYSIDDSEYSGYSTVKVQVLSEVDGVRSITGHTISVLVASGGFGLAFGFNFGENT